MVLYTTKPPVAPGITVAQITQIVDHLTDHFKVVKPSITITHTRNGKYNVQRQTIIVGTKTWRGVHTVVHEFAHHLDMVRRGHAGKHMPRPRVSYRTGNWFDTNGNPMVLTRSSRREFHGESFTLALEECVTAVFGDQNLYSWETEYKTVKSNHARRYHHAGVAPARPVLVGHGWLQFGGGHLRPMALPMAASPVQPVQPVTKDKLKAMGNRAWAAPNAENGFQGGCLWRRRELSRSKPV